MMKKKASKPKTKNPNFEKLISQFSSSFMNHSPAFIYLKDSALRHIYGNKSLLKHFNITLDEFIGTTSYDFMPDDLAKKIKAYDREVIQKGVPIETDEVSFTQKGKLFHFKEFKFPVALAPDNIGVGGIVMDITSLKHTEQSLTEQLEFERLIADIAAKLAQTKPDKLEDKIDWTLQSLGQFLSTERAFLAQFTHNGKSLYHRSIWAAEGIDVPQYLFEMDFAAQSPWLVQQLRNGKVINAGPGLVNLPDEAEDLRKGLEQSGIKSGVVVPVIVEGRSIGMLGLDTINQPREYPQLIVDRLQIVANMIGSMMMRVQSRKALEDSLNQVEQLKEQLEQENIYLRQEVGLENVSKEIIGQSDALRYVLYRVEQVAPTDTTVLILGETGSGKELVARAIHEKSSRTDSHLVTVNCAALPVNLIESELFGRAKGAFTGAHEKQIGRFELAHKGTIFLDEIGELPLELQTKLLRVLQDGTFERLGSPHTIKVNVRIIASTNRDLRAAVQKGSFREDLYYRLDVFPITIPPLRMRKDDIPLLVHTFVNKFSKKLGKTIDKVPTASLKALQEYNWPGNVRELQHVIERAVITSPGTSLCLTDALENPSAEKSASDNTRRLKEREREHIIRILQETNWRIEGEKGAARILDINPNTLRYRMNKLGIHRSQ